MVALHSYPHPYLKDRRRGDRRWRSYCTWVRRLEDHYARYGRWFGRDHKYALRLKDTPTGKCSAAEDRRRDGYHDHDLWETRHDEVVREQHGRYGARKSPRKPVLRLFRKCCCSCGYFLEFAPAWTSRWGNTCDGCKKRFKMPA